MILERMAGDAMAMMADAVFAPGFLDFAPSLVAAAVLVSARHAAGAWPFWPAALALLTGAPAHDPVKVPSCIPCMSRVG